MTRDTSQRIDLIDGLPVLSRLALAYAPSGARCRTLALLAFDARLAGILRGSTEPLLAQLRLAWWRDTLARDPADWPRGEPLLEALRDWSSERTSLSALVDGWEGMVSEEPLGSDVLETLALARGHAFAALARLLEQRESADLAARCGKEWALADLSGRLSEVAEREAALDLARAQDWRKGRLPRALRPLAILHGLAARQLTRGNRLDSAGPGTLLAAMRIGLAGR